jgi:DNA polymerase III delta prime subunit
MKLTRMVVSGLKGRSFDTKVPPLLVVSGPNGTGKTTRLLAVEAGLNGGRFPFVADDSSEFVQVALTFGDVTVQRTISPKHTAVVVPGPTGITPVKGWVAANVGDVSIGQTDFLTITPGAREMRLLDLVKALPDTVPQTPEDVREALSKTVLGVVAPPDRWGDSAGLSCRWLLDATKALRSEKSKRERDSKAVERAIEDLANQSHEEPPGTIAEAKKVVDDTQLELAGARGHLSALKKIGGSVAAHNEQIAQFETGLGEIRTLIAGHGTPPDANRCETCEQLLPAPELVAWEKRRKALELDLKAQERTVREMAKTSRNLPSTLDPVLVEATVVALEQVLKDANDVLGFHQRARAREEERARWLRQREEHRAVLGEVKTALGVLEGWRQKIVSGASKRLAETAQTFVRGVFGDLKFTTVSTDKGCEMRLVRPDGASLPIAAWADSELLVMGVAARLALMDAEKTPWRLVCVDEIQKLDPDRFCAFVHVLASLVAARRLDNVLLAGALSKAHLASIDGALGVGVEVLEAA